MFSNNDKEKNRDSGKDKEEVSNSTWDNLAWSKQIALVAAKNGDLDILLMLMDELYFLNQSPAYRQFCILKENLAVLERKIAVYAEYGLVVSKNLFSKTPTTKDLEIQFTNAINTVKQHFLEQKAQCEIHELLEEINSPELKSLSKKIDAEFKHYQLELSSPIKLQKLGFKLKKINTELEIEHQKLFAIFSKFRSQHYEPLMVKFLEERSRTAIEFLSKYTPPDKETFNPYPNLRLKDIIHPKTNDNLLHIAIRYHQHDVLDFLLAFNTDELFFTPPNQLSVEKNESDENNSSFIEQSVLEEIAYTGNLYAANAFVVRAISLKTIVEIADDQGNTLLHHAVADEKYYALAMVLLEWGADLLQRNKKNVSPWRIIVDILDRYESEKHEAFIMAIGHLIRERKKLHYNRIPESHVPHMSSRSHYNQDLMERLEAEIVHLDSKTKTKVFLAAWTQDYKNTQQLLCDTKAYVTDIIPYSETARLFNNDVMLYERMTQTSNVPALRNNPSLCDDLAEYNFGAKTITSYAAGSLLHDLARAHQEKKQAIEMANRAEAAAQAAELKNIQAEAELALLRKQVESYKTASLPPKHKISLFK